MTKLVTNWLGCSFLVGDVIGQVTHENGKKDIHHVGPCGRCAAYDAGRKALIPKAAKEATVKGELDSKLFYAAMDRLWKEKKI